jgi:quinohemoprotein amine dehydrogenase
LEVTPSFWIARLGGGKTDPVSAQFEAIGIIDLPSPDGSKRSVRLGTVPVHWGIEPYNKVASEMQDVNFAGTIDQTGRFSPAGAGPNPARKFSGNNTGDLSIVATLTGQESPAAIGKAHLIVTIQRWVDPPIY